jgi:TPR repeat protein
MACKHSVLRTTLISALLVTGFSAAPAFAEKRVALVIGNDRYQNLSAERQLQKAANDAQAVGDSLSRIGFQVIRGVNLTRQGMIDKLSELTARLEPGDTAAFFYAGHGVAIGGVNYLVPSDVPAISPDAESRLRGASIAEGDVVAEIQGKGVRVALLVLDACRDNPFPRSGTRAVGGTRGLADAKPARGIFTLYSAGIGQSALDRLEPNDPNRNSVFTRVLIEELGNPGVDLGGLAIEVRERVAELALKAKDDSGQPDPHDQTPAYYDQTIGGRVYLAGLPKSREEAPPSAPRSLVLSQPAGQRLDIVTDCDRLAAAVTDVQRPPSVEGVAADKIDIVPAIKACNGAMREYPDVARFAFQAGRVAHAQKDYGLARQLYETAIARGNVVAMTNLGNLNAGGLGMTQDHAEARRLYEQAAAAGEPVAMYNLGNFYEHGTGVAKDYAEARRLFEKSAAAGVAVSMNAIGLMHEYGYGVDKDYGEARRWYEKAAAGGFAASMTNVGNFYENGRGVTVDHAEARRWYDKAAAAGDARAMNILGVIYQKGTDVPRDYTEARKWYEKSAMGGNSFAMSNLGVLYENGNGVGKDYVQARQWLEKAAAENNSLGMANLGSLYENGHGVPADPATARKWYEKAAAAGETRAMNLIGVMYYNGKGVTQDYAEARKWYEKAAAGNYAASMNNLGVLYELGRGVPKNYDEARKWYEKSATSGNALGMAYLGTMYENGNGAKQDYTEALKWYNKSAALNEPTGMYYLGNVNRDGHGVPKSAAEARKWYEKAAAAGNESAKTALEKLDPSGGTKAIGGTVKRR